MRYSFFHRVVSFIVITKLLHPVPSFIFFLNFLELLLCPLWGSLWDFRGFAELCNVLQQ